MFLIDPVHGSSQHQIIFIAYFLTSFKFCLQNVRFSKRGELKALRAGLKRLQLENLQPMKKKKTLRPSSDAELFMSRTY